MSKRDRHAWPRLRGGASLLVVTAVLAGVLSTGLAASLLTTSARAASSRPVHHSTILPERALASAAPGTAIGGAGALSSGAAFVAPDPGSGGWFWPTGTEDFGGYSGFLEPRGSYLHVAQDMHSPQGHPVYAVGAGTVWISRADTGGYGVGGAPGGCMIIVHRTAAGEEFRALYGHISGLKYKAGERVTAGAVIATVNGCDHLHFGIHPSGEYRDGNPYAGHVPKSWKDYGGWVDPVKYLKAHPHAATYVPPVLPVVRITTGSVPSRYGAAAGIAYWDEQVEGSAAKYAYDLLGGTRRQLAPGETVPAFDEVRYAVRQLTVPALGISVRDRQPVLALEALPASPRWGRSVQLTTTLTNAAGKAFAFARVRLERLDGGAWAMVDRGRTASDGTCVFTVSPARRTVFRAQIFLPLAQPKNATYIAPEIPVVTVVPKVRLSVPALPATVARGRAVMVTGSLVPRHATGKGSVRLEFQRLTIGGVWAPAVTVGVVLSYGAASSLYARGVKLSTAGAWRVRAVHPACEAHAATLGGWRTFAVK